MVLSGEVSDANGIESGILIKHGVEFEKEELKSSLDEADYRIIQHIANARKTDRSELLLHPMIPLLSFMLFLISYHLILRNFG